MEHTSHRRRPHLALAVALAALAAAPAAAGAQPLGPAPLRSLDVVDPSVGGCSYADGNGLSEIAYRGHTVYAYTCYAKAGAELSIAATIDSPVKCSPTNPTCTAVFASAVVVYLGDTATHEIGRYELRQPSATVTTGGHTYVLDLRGAAPLAAPTFAGLVRAYADDVLGRALTFNPTSAGASGRLPTIDGSALAETGSVAVDVPLAGDAAFHGVLSLTGAGADAALRLDGVWNQPTDRVLTIHGAGALSSVAPGDGTCRLDVGGLAYQLVDGAGATGGRQYPAALRISARVASGDGFCEDWPTELLLGEASTDFVRFMLTHTMGVFNGGRGL